MSALTTFPNMSDSDWNEFGLLHIAAEDSKDGLEKFCAYDKIEEGHIEALTLRARQHWCACRVGVRRSQVMLGRRAEYRQHRLESAA